MRRKNKYSCAAIAAHINGESKYNGAKSNNGKPISARRVSQMLRHPEQGKNRERLTAALTGMGMSEKTAEMFIG